MIREFIANYQPGVDVTELVRQTPIVLLVGISGAGKDSIKKRLLKTGRYQDFVSYTTRSPRSNKGVMERDGVDYHFVSLDEMERLLRDGQMIEAKQYSGNVYGTGVKDLRAAKEAGKIAINDIEVQGTYEYKQISSDVHAVFLLPPSYDVWYERLVARYGADSVDKKDLALRMETALYEIDTALESELYTFVINANLDAAVATVDEIANGRCNAIETETSRQVAEDLRRDISTHLERVPE